MVEIERISPLTGEWNKIQVDITKEQIEEWNSPTRTRLIQDIFPNLNEDEREFIMTGYTPADWKQMEAGLNE